MTQEANDKAADRPATRAETLAAIDSMSKKDETQIRKAAVFHLRKLLARGSRSVDELIDEATDRLADGRRTWFPAKVKLVTVVSGTMQSIVSEWNDEHRRLFSASEEVADAALAKGRVRGAVESVNLERQAVSGDLVEFCLRWAGDDPVKWCVVEHGAQGYKKREIPEVCGAPKTICYAIIKELRELLLETFPDWRWTR